MRFATLKTGELVAVNGEKAAPLAYEGEMLGLVQRYAELKDTLVFDSANARSFDLKDLATPLANPSKIIAIGLNYVDHASETKLELPKTPLVFTKFPSSLTGATDPIKLPTELTQQVDYEVELGVVMGKAAKNISKTNALDYVFGYTVMNDISARDLQFSDGQWVRGKSLDTFGPTGPVIVTVDEVPDPQMLTLGCSINGKTLQEASTKDMIFSVADLIEQLSHSFTLEPGDIIASGTPSGVGFTREPTIFLQPGDTLRTWVECIGELVNPVVSA